MAVTGDSPDSSENPHNTPPRPSARTRAEKSPAYKRKPAASESRPVPLDGNYLLADPGYIPADQGQGRADSNYPSSEMSDARSGAPTAGTETKRRTFDARFKLFAALGLMAIAGSAIYLLASSRSSPHGSVATARPGASTGPAVSSGSSAASSGTNAVPPAVTATEVRFGMAGPFTGPSKELGREMAIGLRTAFDEANAAGGVAGRRIQLVTADDGYEPGKTGDAVTNLRDRAGVLGYVGNIGTPTAAVSLPYALRNRMLFFGAFTGAESLRRTPPDRYVFNYRPSYAEETEAAVRYLVRVRGIRPKHIAVFTQQDAFGDSGYEGVLKAMRGLGVAHADATLRMGYERNSLDLTKPVRLLGKQKDIKAVIMVASYRAAAKFIELTHRSYPGLTYTNVSFVGGTALADELKLLGPGYTDRVIVTQTVPDIEGFSNIAMEYRASLAHSFSGEQPNYVSFEGFIEGKLLAESLRRTGQTLNVDSLVRTMEGMRGVELGLGTPVSFSPSEHQASHKVWGTQLSAMGTYVPIDLE